MTLKEFLNDLGIDHRDLNFKDDSIIDSMIYIKTAYPHKSGTLVDYRSIKSVESDNENDIIIELEKSTLDT